MKIHSFAKILALCGAVALVAGCVSYKQQMTFESDGSGRMVLDVWVPYYGVEKTGPAADEKLTAELDEEMVVSFADREGVRIDEKWAKLEAEEDERLEHIHVVVAFDDIEKLNVSDILENQKITFRSTGDGFIYEQAIIRERGEAAEEALEPEYEELTRTLFEGFTFTYTVVMPGRVVESNGSIGEDGRTVTWEWPLYDFVKKEEVIMTAKAAKE